MALLSPTDTHVKNLAAIEPDEHLVINPTIKMCVGGKAVYEMPDEDVKKWRSNKPVDEILLDVTKENWEAVFTATYGVPVGEYFGMLKKIENEVSFSIDMIDFCTYLSLNRFINICKNWLD